MSLVHTLTALIVLLSWLSPVDQTVTAFSANPPGVASTAPVASIPPPAALPSLPALPAFTPTDYALVPRTTMRDGIPVADVYTQGASSVPAMHVRALDFSIPDPKLRDAFDIAMSFSPEFQQEVAAAFVSGGNRVVWDDGARLGPNTWAQARPRDHLILVNTRLKGASAFDLAPVLAHEAYHVVFNGAVKKGPDCYQAETTAHLWETRIWNKVSAYALLEQGGSAGTPTDVQIEEMTQAQAAEDGTMAQYIFDAYHLQCAL